MTVFSLSHTCQAVLAAGAVLLGSLLLVPSLAAEETADEYMARAHAGRAVWKNFPGFTADITAATAGRATKGTLKVGADGDVSIELADNEGMEWVTRTLESIVSHRLADDGAITNLEFADDDRHHPLCRLLKSQSATDKNLWRVKGDVLTEVQRFLPKTRFIISVTDVSRTKEGKHLPRSYNVTTWNLETGAIESARQVFNEWTRI